MREKFETVVEIAVLVVKVILLMGAVVCMFLGRWDQAAVYLLFILVLEIPSSRPDA